MSTRPHRALWTAAAVAFALSGAALADEFDELRAMPTPERVSPEAFTAPDPFQPSADLGIVPIPIEHFSPVGASREIDTVVIHYTSAVNVEPDDPYDIDMNVNIFNMYRVSSHYMIGRDGTIHQLVRESDRAWHAGRSIMPEPDNRQGVNDFSVGIEVLCIHGEPYEDAQYDALIALVRDIRSRCDVPMSNILGHEDIAGARIVEMGLRSAPKTDPGPSFDWERFRAGLEGE